MAYESYPLACPCKAARDGEVQGEISIRKHRKVLRYHIRPRACSKIPSFRLTHKDKLTSDLFNTADTDRERPVFPGCPFHLPCSAYWGWVQVPSQDSGLVTAAGISVQFLVGLYAMDPDTPWQVPSTALPPTAVFLRSSHTQCKIHPPGPIDKEDLLS